MTCHDVSSTTYIMCSNLCYMRVSNCSSILPNSKLNSKSKYIQSRQLYSMSCDPYKFILCTCSAMRRTSLLLLCLLWSLVEVHSQTAPYLTFNDSVIPNHAYVDLSLMMYPGNDDTTADTSSTVICHTNLASCCRGSDGGDGGDWYFPDGGPLPGAGINNENQQHPIAQRKLNQLVRLQRGPTSASGIVPDGIYRCDIDAVNSDDNTARETVYVGVYGSGGTCNMHTCVYSRAPLPQSGLPEVRTP